MNFDVPRQPERTCTASVAPAAPAARARRCRRHAPAEQSRLRQIERTTRQSLIQVETPTPVRVSAHKVTGLLARTAERKEIGRLELLPRGDRRHLAQNPDVDRSTGSPVSTALAVGDEGPVAASATTSTTRCRVRT